MRITVSSAIIIVLIILAAGFVALSVDNNYRPLSDKPAAINTTPLRLVFVGDVLLSRTIGDIIAREGPAFPFEHMHDVLSEGDITMGNLETTLTDSSTAVCDKDPHYCFRAPPESVKGLVYAGFDIMTVANNHALDYGPAVMNDTLSHLTTAGIRYDGAQQAPGDTVQKAVMFDRSGVRVAYLGFNDVWFYTNATGYLTNKYSPGDYPRPWNASEETVIQSVKQARSQADIVVVNFHFGKEYNFTHSMRQEELSHLAADAGADIIVGHHPHVIQDLEVYNGSVIAYSLGNFIFDAKGTGAREGGLLTVLIDPDSKQLMGYSFDKVFADPEFQPWPGFSGRMISYYERVVAWSLARIRAIVPV